MLNGAVSPCIDPCSEHRCNLTINCKQSERNLVRVGKIYTNTHTHTQRERERKCEYIRYHSVTSICWFQPEILLF